MNEDNIDKFNKRKIKKIFKNEDAKCVQTYLHNILNKYHTKNNEFSLVYLDKIKSLIRKTGIKMNFQEEQRIFDFEECVFTKIRNLKKLDTNLNLAQKEFVVAKYERSWLYYSRNGLWRENIEGQLYITNKSIIVLKNEQLIKIFYSSILRHKIDTIGFKFYLKRNEELEYLLRLHSNETLGILLEKVLKKYT